MITSVGYELQEFDPARINPGGDKQILHLSRFPAEVDASYDVEVGIQADISATLDALAAVGDGAFLMNSQEIETALLERIALTVLIWQDDAYGLIRWKMDLELGHDVATGFANPDFVASPKASAPAATGSTPPATCCPPSPKPSPPAPSQ